MKSALNISLTFRQILDLVKQLPRAQKIRLTKELEKEAISSRLTDLLQTFRTAELPEDLIDQEVETVRQELYEQAKKQ